MKGRERDREKRSVLGLGGPAPGSELSKWRPSKAGQSHDMPALWQAEKTGREQNQPLQGEVTPDRDSQLTHGKDVLPAADGDAHVIGEDAWRPSEAVKERLSSLAPVRRRRRFALPRSMRLVASALIFVVGIYACVKLWTMPTEMDLHPALIVFGVVLVLLLIGGIVNAISRRRRAHEDEKSTLRL